MNSAPPIRIAFCITGLEPGGAERCLVELVKRLDRRRFDPVVYCLGPRPCGNPTSLADELEAAEITVHCLDARRRIQFPRILRKLRVQLAVDRPQIMQTFLFHANALGTFAAHAAGVPHIVTGIRVAERRLNGHLALARWTARWVDRHVCVSQTVRDFSRRQAGLPAEKLVVIPNGVDTRRFASAVPCPLSSLGITPGRRIITHIGRHDPQKGLDWLLELMPRIFAQLPQHDLVLVGAGPQGESLRRRAQSLGVSDRVHFVGFRRDVPEILAASDLFVLPSRWEGMPNVVLEAMASAKPVVATAVEGVAELLGDTAGEQMVDVTDANGFASQVLRILADPSLAQRLGQQNRLRVQRDFSLETMAGAYQELYQSLLAPQK